jgi:hypothetical protein
MPNWLHNTLYVMILIVSMGCVASGLEWKSNKKADKNESH